MRTPASGRGVHGRTGVVGQLDPAAAQRRRAERGRLGGGAQHVRRPADEHGAAGMTVPAGTSVPSPRMQPSPSREPGMRMAPLPISHRSPTRGADDRGAVPEHGALADLDGVAGPPEQYAVLQDRRMVAHRDVRATGAHRDTLREVGTRPDVHLPTSTAEAATSAAGCAGRARLRLICRPPRDRFDHCRAALSPMWSNPLAGGAALGSGASLRPPAQATVRSSYRSEHRRGAFVEPPCPRTTNRLLASTPGPPTTATAHPGAVDHGVADRAEKHPLERTPTARADHHHTGLGRGVRPR